MAHADVSRAGSEGVIVASGRGTDAATAAFDVARRLRAALVVGGSDPSGTGPALCAVLVFVSPVYDAAAFASALQQHFHDTPVYGCTTSGELTPEGENEGGVVAVGFRACNFSIVAQPISDLSQFQVEQGRALCFDMLGKMQARVPGAARSKMFGLLLIDGLCRREEAVISAIYSALDDIPVVGGSAGDGLRFEKTYVIEGGAAHSDAALLLLFHTELPFQLFKCDYFEPTEHKMVVTEVDAERRIVRELNAEPAAYEYARTAGLAEYSLDPFSFASHPVLVGVGGQYYARSIQRVNPDGSLSFFCAIDEGLVLTAAKCLDIVACTKSMFERLDAELGDLSTCIAFECVLRRLDAERLQISHELVDLYRANRVVGFNTYGEQFRSMHVNQTLAGVAIGSRSL